MRNLFTISIAVLIGSSTMFAQNVNDVYVVAGNDVKHISFKEINVLDGKGAYQNAIPFSQTDLNQISAVAKVKKSNCTCDLGSTNYIAALSVDSKDNLLCMSMLGNNFFKKGQNGVETFNHEISNANWDEKMLFARMATTPDGSVYALNNAGSDLLKIDATNNTVTSLGEVKGFSAIFAQFEDSRVSYGGDMIADANGNLYVITARGHIVKIDMNSISAVYVGQIYNLPEQFTTNGAAVLKNNKIMLASSQPNDFYVVDIDNFKAEHYAANTLPVYDLASKYFLKSAPANGIINASITIIPTIVRENYFNVTSATDLQGNSTINIYSADGKLMQSQTKQIVSGINTVSIGKVPQGIYLVKILDSNGNAVNTTKIEVF